MSLEDILKKYEEENNYSSSTSYAPTPKRKTFFSRFGENWMEGGNRIVDSHKEYIKTLKSDQSFKDKAIRTWNTGASEAMSALDMVFGSVIYGAIGPSGLESPDKEPNKILSGIQKGMDFAGSKYTEGLNQFLDEDLNEKEREIANFVGGEGLAESVGFGVTKGIGIGAKTLGKASTSAIKNTSKKFGNMRFSKSDVEKSFNDFKGDLDKQSSVFSGLEVNPDRMTKNLRDLMEKVGNGDTNIAEVKKISKELGIDSTPYIKRLEDVANNNYYKSKSLSNSFVKLSKGLSEKTYKKVKKSLSELGYGKGVAENKIARRNLISQGFEQNLVDKTIKAMNEEIALNKSPHTTKIEEFLSESKLKGEAKANGDYSFYDTATNSRRGEYIKYLEDNGLARKSIVDHRVTGEKIYRFDYTEKGLAELKNIDYESFAENYNGSLKQNHIQNGFAEYPIKDYKDVAQKVDEGKVISVAEINNQINELSGDADFSALDIMKFNKSVGDELDIKKLTYHLDNLNKKYGIKLDESIEKIKSGDTSIIDEVFKKLDELKKNEYITVDRLKNPGKTINFSTQTGVTNRLFKTLRSNVEKLSEGDLNKKLGQIKTKINSTRQKILRKYEGDEITIRAKLKNLDIQHKAQILEVKAKYAGIDSVKKELKKHISEIGKKQEFMGDINKVIKKALLPGNWEDIISATDLKKKINQINKDIEVEHARGLVRAIKDELKGQKLTNTNKGAKSQKITIEQAMQLDQASKVFSRIKYGDLNVKDLQDLLKEIKEVKSTGRSKKLMADKEFAKSINDSLRKMEGDIQPLAGKKNIENRTFTDKVKGYWNSYDNATLFANRLIEKIFGKNKEAFDRFVGDVSEAYNRFESFEIKYSDKLAKNIGMLFKGNVEKIEEFGQFLYARRRLYDEDGISWIGLDRIMHDRTSSYFKKTDEYLNVKKPEFWSELPDEMWDKIKKTELAGIMLKHNDEAYKKAIVLWDKYHELTGKMINKTRLEVDNQFIEPDDFYISFQALRGPNSEIVAELGDTKFYGKYISPASLKRLTKEIKNGDFVWDYNPISSLYGNGRNARYYAFMQRAHKNMIGLYDGPSKQFKASTIDEINEFSSNPEKYSFSKGSKKIQVEGEIADNGTGKIEALVGYEKDVNGNIETIWKQEYVDIDDITVTSKGSGLKDKLSDEGRYRLRKYIDRVGTGGSTMESSSERILAQMANHFNRLPLMGSASVILKQPLSLIDAQGMVGPKNLAQAQSDLLRVKGISSALDDIPSIHNRGGGDFLIKELKNHTPGSGWFDNMAEKYNGYVDVAMAPIKYADQWTYKQIWLSAYRDALTQKGIIAPDQRMTVDMLKNVDPEAMKYADDIANRSASTANPLLMPQVYDRAWSKALFGIFTTQLNRLQIMFKDVPDLYKDGRKAQALYLGASLMTSNIAEYAVTIGVGKGMYAVGATTWEGYDKDWKELMVSKDMLNRITIDQLFLWSKFQGAINPNFGVAPVIGGVTKISKDLDEALKSPDIETISKLSVDLLGGKWTEQLRNIIKNSQ